MSSDLPDAGNLSEVSPVRVLRLPQVKARIGMGRSWIYAAMKRGDFPAPVRLSIRAVGWRVADVDAWIAGRQTTGA